MNIAITLSLSLCVCVCVCLDTLFFLLVIEDRLTQIDWIGRHASAAPTKQRMFFSFSSPFFFFFFFFFSDPLYEVRRPEPKVFRLSFTLLLCFLPSFFCLLSPVLLLSFFCSSVLLSSAVLCCQRAQSPRPRKSDRILSRSRFLIPKRMQTPRKKCVSLSLSISLL